MLKCEFQRAFHTFVHFFSHQFTENVPFSSYTRHNTDVFLLIHPLNITQARAAVLPETKGGCRHAKSQIQNSPFGLLASHLGHSVRGAEACRFSS